ncbi:hypothetical protein GWI33_012866 [Rhynchophorus ferrugineus]|uniref:Coiled-coil domain-containing protein 86 n=1 Tax=Rhynchophorus ferrugineus TaxID=354439 RepID=A0A834II12_RHYFE|nr:hypothetical protein GWI33_012866 [Rhynchophorus ferrugineus]
MEDILNKTNPESNESSKNENVLKKKQKKDAVIKGQPRSGRFWKSERKKFSSVVKSKGLKSTLERRKAQKEKFQRIKEASDQLKAEKKEQEEARKQRRRENMQRQEENRKKSEVVQVVTNTKKLKRMKKKQLRFIEKRDTTVVQK